MLNLQAFGNHNLDAAARPEVFEGKEAYLDQAVALHYIREGMSSFASIDLLF
jgi:hypothetical protein